MLQHIGAFVVHGGVFIIELHGVVAEDDTLCRDGVDERHAVRVKGITLDEYILVVTCCLFFGVFNHGVDGDDTLGKLIALYQIVVKKVVDDFDIQATPAFIPPLGIARQ